MLKKTFQTYSLYFQMPLHIGDVRPDDYGNSESFIRSDTLMAAITSMLGKIGKIGDDFNGQFSFRVSSLFPFTTIGDKVHYFFPKLSTAMPVKTEKDKPLEYAKKLKKLKWLDLHYFEAQLNQHEFNQFGNEAQKDIRGEFCSTAALPEDGFVTKQVSQRVTIPRERVEGEDPTPFYMERLFFGQGSGLYFLVEGTGTDILEEGLNLLQYEGLGTDRTIGNGAFTWNKDTIELEIPESDFCTNLSLFCPESKSQLEEMLNEKSSYDTLKRSGWITAEGYQTFRKKGVYMFTEGSVFKGDAKPKGRMAINITPDADFIKTSLPHKIYRCGESIFLPVKL
jgi:CRISPR type III-A-associated RAMP protein Csm4